MEEENTPQDQNETDPTQASAGESEKEFDPDEVENDPAYNPEQPGLKGLKGG